MLCAILDVRGCLVIAKFSATNRESRKLENSEKKAQSPQMQLCGQATASLPGAWPGWPAQAAQAARAAKLRTRVSSTRAVVTSEAKK